MRFLALVALILSTPCIAAAQSAMDETWPIIERGLASGDMLARGAAVAALPQVTGQNTESILKEALSDPQWPVRKQALIVLAGRSDALATKLVGEALRDMSAPLADDAFCLIKAFKGTTGRDLLVKALQEPTLATKPALYQAVVNQPADIAVPYLEVGLLAGDELAMNTLLKAPLVKQDPLVAALAKSKNPKIVGIIFDQVQAGTVNLPSQLLEPWLKSKDNTLKIKAAEILAQRGDVAAVKVLRPLADGDEASRLKFFKAVAATPVGEYHKMLETFLAPDIPIAQHEYVYRGLAGTTNHVLFETILKQLKSTVPEVREVAAKGLVGLMGNRALPHLHELLFDGNAGIRKIAAQGIGERAQAESVPVLEKAVRDMDLDVRRAVVEALSKIKDKSVVGVASFLVYDSDPEIKKSAIMALCNANHEDALTVLRLQVQDRDPDIAREVLGAIIALAPDTAGQYIESLLVILRPDDIAKLTIRFGERFLPFLQQIASSSRSSARLTAIETVRLIPDKEVEFLKTIVATNQYADSRIAALKRLRCVSCDEGRDVALALLNDKEAEVRNVALKVLKSCGNADNAAAVRNLLTDPEESVRVNAAATFLALSQVSKPKAKGKGK